MYFEPSKKELDLEMGEKEAQITEGVAAASRLDISGGCNCKQQERLDTSYRGLHLSRSSVATDKSICNK